MAAVVISLAMLEVAIRLLHPEATRSGSLARLERERESAGGWNEPGAEFHHVGDGIYKLKFPSPSELTRSRIMLVGDSFVMGAGASVGETRRFGTLLQQSLGPEVKVDVLATTTYSPIIYRNIVRKALSLAQYKAVAVFVDQTDPVDDFVYEGDLSDASSHLFDLESMRERRVLVQQTYQRTIEELSTTDLLSWVSPRRFALFNLLRPVSLAGAFPKDSRHYPYIHLWNVEYSSLLRQFEVAPGSDVTRRMESLLFRNLDEIVALCRERGVPLLLAANPWEYQVSKKPHFAQVPGPYPRENRLEQIIRDRYRDRPGIRLIALTPAFRADPDPSRLFLHRPATEIHWNREGHALVEGVLRPFLREYVVGRGATDDPLHARPAGDERRAKNPKAIRP
jgi:hypothetical protein